MSSPRAPEPPRRRPAALIVRDADAGAYVEQFVITAAATILIVRAFLAATGYPQLGGRGLHVAHALWGGLAMAAGVLLLLVSLSRRAKALAALLGGAGFGLFIDEVGKFLTRDTNYFFRPSFAIMYVVFVALFLLVRVRLSARALDRDEALANAITLMREQALGDLDPDEKSRALALLQPIAASDPRAAELSAMLRRLDTIAAPAPGRVQRWERALLARVDAVVARRTFLPAVAIALLLQSAAVIAWALSESRIMATVAPPGEHLGEAHIGWWRLACGVATAVLTALGVARRIHSRARALRAFRRALHVSLLVTQILVFYQSPPAGLLLLALNLLLLGGVDRAARRGHERGPAASAAGA